MYRRSLFFASLSLSLFLLSAHSPAQRRQSYLKPGDILPLLASQALYRPARSIVWRFCPSLL
jgi:hypothetical protein